jgi:hypothetical protein
MNTNEKHLKCDWAYRYAAALYFAKNGDLLKGQHTLLIFPKGISSTATDNFKQIKNVLGCVVCFHEY